LKVLLTKARDLSVTRIAVAGVAGRMGRNLVQACYETDTVRLTAATESSDSNFLGVDAGELAGIGKNGVIIDSRLQEHVDDFDVLIDFTVPEATMRHLDICRVTSKRIVIGTTGLIEEQRQRVILASDSVPVVMAPNMSIGINLCLKLIGIAAKIIGNDADIEIIEAHHRHKVDAPSGTALDMGKVLAEALGRDLKECAVYGREGHTGKRDQSIIGFETIRAGDIVGEHTVMFADIGERLEITHRASSRMTFAKGAVRAADWIMQHQRGLYDMQDVLGLKG